MQEESVLETIKNKYRFVNLVFGTHVIHRLPEFIYRILCTGKKVYECPESDGVIAENLPVHRDGKFKAWLPIMYGCKYLNFSRSNSELDLIARKIIDEFEGAEGVKYISEYSDTNTERGQRLRNEICKRLSATCASPWRR